MGPMIVNDGTAQLLANANETDIEREKSHLIANILGTKNDNFRGEKQRLLTTKTDRFKMKRTKSVRCLNSCFSEMQQKKDIKLQLKWRVFFAIFKESVVQRSRKNREIFTFLFSLG